MSIRIFGSVRGGVITDATATPDVVRKNEIFYNNNGRQVGTLVVPTMYDANAYPEDVASGKIFYNRNGKQTGTGTIMKTLVYNSKQLASASSSIEIDTSMSGPEYDYTDGQLTSSFGTQGSYETVNAIIVPNGYRFRYGKVSWKSYKTNTVYIYSYITKDNQKPAVSIKTDSGTWIWISLQETYLYVYANRNDALRTYPFTVTLYLD